MIKSEFSYTHFTAKKNLFRYPNDLSVNTQKTFEIFCDETDRDLCWSLPIHDRVGNQIGIIRHGSNLHRPNLKYELKQFSTDDILFNYHRIVSSYASNTLVLVNDIRDCLRLWDVGVRRVLCLLSPQLSCYAESMLVNAAAGQNVVLYCRETSHCTSMHLLISRLSSKMFVKQIIAA